jgi:hypothetical protein
LDSAVIARQRVRAKRGPMTGRFCSCARGRGPDLAQRIFFEKTFSLNACVSNVFVVIQSCDSCRIHGHLLNDRAPIARDATQKILRMSGAHARHLAFALACANESR